MTASALRRLRRGLGLSQARFAERLGVASNTVARWERGERTIGRAMDRLVRLVVAQVEADRPAAGKVHRRAGPDPPQRPRTKMTYLEARRVEALFRR